MSVFGRFRLTGKRFFIAGASRGPAWEMAVGSPLTLLALTPPAKVASCSAAGVRRRWLMAEDLLLAFASHASSKLQERMRSGRLEKQRLFIPKTID